MHIWLLRTLRLFWEELLTSLKKSTVWKCLYISRSQIKFNKILGLIHLNGTDLNQKVLSQRPTNCTSRKSNIATFAKTRLISLHDQCLENSLRNVRAWLCVHGVIPSFFFFFLGAIFSSGCVGLSGVWPANVLQTLNINSSARLGVSDNYY